MSKKVIILGAGISGLTTAFLLHEKGYNVKVIEKKSVPGGSMESLTENGYMFDKGPNSALETTPLIAEIVEKLGIQDEMIYSNKEANKRYILRDNALHPMPTSPPAFFKTKLFSASGKLRLMSEPFVGRSKDGYYQSIADFVKRRFGQEFLDYAINPFVAGVYAGNPEQLSVKSAFPKLYDLEEKYGGVIVGAIKSMRERKKRAEKSKSHAKMFTFKKGMQTLPNAIADRLKDNIVYSAEAETVLPREVGGYTVKYKVQDGNTETAECDIIISTIPAYSAAELFKPLDDTTAGHLSEVYYPPVLVLYAGYKKRSIKQPLDGFGFLIPAKEKKSYLGAIWSSTIFPGRAAGDDTASFTLFIGGSRNSDIFNMETEDIIKKVTAEFGQVMGIEDKPVYLNHKFWRKAIPQYNVGYIEHEKAFEEFEKKFPGIILSGNYRGGISVGDCIKSAGKITEQF